MTMISKGRAKELYLANEIGWLLPITIAAISNEARSDRALISGMRLGKFSRRLCACRAIDKPLRTSTARSAA